MFKRLFHKHDFEKVGHKLVYCGLRSSTCVDVYVCSKCGKVKYGEYRSMTQEEKLGHANNYRNHLKGDDEK